jgi:hypothetical protein
MDALSRIEGKFFYLDKPYNGVAFDCNESASVKAFSIQDGTIIAPYNPAYFLDADGSTGIDATEIWEEQDQSIEFPQYHQGSPYTGVAYGFDGMDCYREASFTDGEWTVDSQWVRGSQILLDLNNPDIYESYGWYSTGEFKRISIEWKNECAIGFGFHEDRRLHYINLKGSPSKIDELSKKAFHFPISNLQTLEPYKLDETVTVCGDIITDEYIAEMFALGLLGDVKVMRFHEANIGKSCHQILKKMPKLQIVRISSSRKEQIELAEELRRALPNIVIETQKFD